MADNLAVTPGTGATVGADLISTVLYQRVKLIYGDDGVNSGDVSTTNPFPCNVNQIGGSAFALGQQLAAASLPVVLTASQLTSLTTGLTLGAGSALIGATPPQPLVASASFTRVADTNAYAVGDFIANNTLAASCTAANSAFIVTIARANDRPGRLTGAVLDKSGTGITNAIFRVHLFSSNPLTSAPANGDNGAFAPANRAGYLGYIDFSLTTFAFGDGVRARGTFGASSPYSFNPTSGAATLYGLLEARGAYTPASAEVYTLVLEAE